MSRVSTILRSLGYTKEVCATQLRVNDLEGEFLAHAASLGCSGFVRHGWPDFLMRRSDGQPVFVEVKASPDDKLRKLQVECFTALEAMGLDVRVWVPQRPNDLTAWRAHQRRARKRRS